MREVFKVAASTTMKRAYRDLLKEEFSESALAECLSLFRHLLESTGYSIRFEWDERPAKRHRKHYPIPAAATDYLRAFLEQANDDGVTTDVPEHVPDKTALERQTWMAGVFLTFQSRVKLEGDVGFARDVQSLLYQLCIHVLSPKLAGKHLHDPNAFLLNALYAHAKNFWTDRPEHQTYLLSALYEHTGQFEEALVLLRASLNNSSAEEHDFVTKVQAYWSLLIESARVEEAKAFVLEMYRKAGAKDLPELQELLDETYGFDKRREAS